MKASIHPRFLGLLVCGHFDFGQLKCCSQQKTVIDCQRQRRRHPPPPNMLTLPNGGLRGGMSGG
jgi:hypothetical protein